MRVVRIELVENLVDLAFGLVVDPAIDHLEIGAAENLGVVILADGLFIGGRHARLRIDQHQRVGDAKLRRHRFTVDDAEVVLARSAVRTIRILVRGRRGFAKLAVLLEAVRAFRAGFVIGKQRGQHPGIGGIDLVRVQSVPERLQHVGLGFAARARCHHRHRGADRIGREDDIAGLPGENPEQVEARLVIGLDQRRRFGALCRGQRQRECQHEGRRRCVTSNCGSHFLTLSLPVRRDRSPAIVTEPPAGRNPGPEQDVVIRRGSGSGQSAPWYWSQQPRDRFIINIRRQDG